MDENSSRFWVIPIICFVSVTMILIWSADVRMNTEERFIPEPVIIPKQVSSLSPYVEFCTPGGFAPEKLIQNNTHKFDHDVCLWENRN